MADADDKLDFCKQALGELGTRSTITSLDPPDGSQEAYYCNLFFNGTRDQILRAAHWNFAGRSDTIMLWKAAPGTPENPSVSAHDLWSTRNPAPPWLYSYRHPDLGIVAIRRLRGQAQNDQGTSGVPFYGGAIGNTVHRQPPVPFEVALDSYDRAGQAVASTRYALAVTIVSPGQNYRPGDYITMSGDASSLMGQPITLHVFATNTAGSVTDVRIKDGGSFGGATISLSQSDTTGIGTGFACSGSFFPYPIDVNKIILTDARNPVVDFTTNIVNVIQYDPLFADAFMVALEGKLALALIGDRALYTAKLQEANNSIINARVRDGNEGLAVYDFVPDWLQVRGVSSMGASSSWFNPPYGPLFAV